MDRKKPLILITNDDGYQAKGINALIESVKDLGEVVVLAPDGPRSGASSAITSLHPLRVHLEKSEENLQVFSCTGTPVDCVKIALNEILDRKPDLVLSGINHGSNAAVSVLYSGTMGAAIEGAIFQIPSVGFSLLDHSKKADFSFAVKYTRLITEYVLKKGMAVGTCLNVNIPKGSDIKGIKACRQTKGQWVSEFLPSKDGANKDVYWLTGRFDNHEPNDESTDEWALKNKYVSVVPVKVDMTDHAYIDALRDWENLI